VKHVTILATLCLLTSRGAFAMDPYGLMFTTPEQRSRLDNRFDGSDGKDTTAPANRPSDALAPQSLKLNGTLISNTGRKEVWINGRPQVTAATGAAADIRVLGPDVVQVRPSPTARPRQMKPGQVMDTASGEIREAYRKTTGSQGR
jgi:hypothetical protein